MKALNISVVVLVLLSVLFYLAGSFCEATFNLVLWSRDLRVGLGVAFIFISLFVILIIAVGMPGNQTNK